MNLLMCFVFEAETKAKKQNKKKTQQINKTEDEKDTFHFALPLCEGDVVAPPHVKLLKCGQMQIR